MKIHNITCCQTMNKRHACPMAPLYEQRTRVFCLASAALACYDCVCVCVSLCLCISCWKSQNTNKLFWFWHQIASLIFILRLIQCGLWTKCYRTTAAGACAPSNSINIFLNKSLYAQYDCEKSEFKLKRLQSICKKIRQQQLIHEWWRNS